MIHSFRLKRDGYMVALVMVVLLLAVAWPTPAAAGPPPPPESPADETEVPQPPPEVPQPEVPQPEVPQPEGPQPEGPDTPSDPGPPADSAPNRIVMHPATPAQLCKVGDGLQYYFVSAGGSTVTGPFVQSFSQLAAMYPAGASVSLYTGTNPFTGKPVQIDYLPAEKKVRVSTFYPDNEYDTNKPYVFTFGSDHGVTHEAW